MSGTNAAPKLPVQGKRNILITSALPYVNNVPHLGNLIGCVLSADIYSRFCRIRGHNSVYVCGTDEYGTATETKAREEKMTPRQICDKYNAIHEKIYNWFNIDFDQFGRTTNEHHATIAQEIFTQNDDNNNIVTKDMQQLYCAGCELWLADRYVEGNCPKCDSDQARGDQCDTCGQTFDACDLKQPKCAHCKVAPESKTTTHLFLDLPKLTERLSTEYVDKSMAGGLWTLNTQRTTQAWLNEGLQHRCVSRDLKWGTPVPKEGFTDKVFYVWFDAPIGYVSITAMYTPEWRQWWHNPSNVELVQFMGKDNIPFHTVIFPASQIGTGTDWTMAHRISTTEYLNYENGKFSKSRNTGVFGDNVQESGIPADVYRYYLLRTRPEGADSVFDWEDLAAKCNNELLTNLGNFVNRAIKFTNNAFDSKIPASTEQTEEDLKLVSDVSAKVGEYISLLENMQLKDALSALMAVSKLGNTYMQNQAPWVEVKKNPPRGGAIIYTCLTLVKLLAALLHPYMPTTSTAILTQLNLPALTDPLGSATLVPEEKETTPTPADPKKHAVFSFEWRPFEEGGQHALPAAHEIGTAFILVKKIESKTVKALRRKFGGVVEEDEETGPPFNAYLSVGEIIEAKTHPVNDGLFVLQVQMVDKLPTEAKAAPEEKKAAAPEKKNEKKRKPKKGVKETAPVLLPKRQIVSGLVGHYTAEELVGKKIVVLVNLPPRKFKGIASEGMLLTAIQEVDTEGDEDAKATKVIKLLTCDAPHGTQILPEGHRYEHKKTLKLPKDLKKLTLTTDATGGAQSKGIRLQTKAGVVVVAETGVSNAKIG